MCISKKITGNEGTIVLRGQFSLNKSACLLPCVAGNCVYEITVLKGKIQVNHNAYTPDGGTWLGTPIGNNPKHYKVKEGETKNIKFFILENFGKLDRVEIVNLSLIHETVLKFKFREDREKE